MRSVKNLPKAKCEYFHCNVTKLLYVQKRVQPDIGSAIAFLMKRVKDPDLDDLQAISSDRIFESRLGLSIDSEC